MHSIQLPPSQSQQHPHSPIIPLLPSVKQLNEEARREGATVIGGDSNEVEFLDPPPPSQPVNIWSKKNRTGPVYKYQKVEEGSSTDTNKIATSSGDPVKPALHTRRRSSCIPDLARVTITTQMAPQAKTAFQMLKEEEKVVSVV